MTQQPDTRAMPNGTERPGEHWNARLIREATTYRVPLARTDDDRHALEIERDAAFAELDHVSAALNRTGINGPGNYGDRIDATAEQLAALRTRLGTVTAERGEPRTEWTWRHNNYVSTASATTDRSSAERSITRRRATSPGDPVTLMRRTVTDWTPADDHDTVTPEPTDTTRRECTALCRDIEADRDALTQALEAADTVRIDRDDSIWRVRTDGRWRTRYLDPMTLAEVEAALGPTRPALLVYLDGDDEQPMPPVAALGSPADRAQDDVTRLLVTVTWNGDYYQPYERAAMLRDWITAALHDRDDCPTVDITETPALRPADWEQQATDAMTDAWSHVEDDAAITAQRLAEIAVRAIIDAGLAGPGGRCPACGGTYPRTMPAGEDPRCWTCSTGDQTGLAEREG